MVGWATYIYIYLVLMKCNTLALGMEHSECEHEAHRVHSSQGYKICLVIADLGDSVCRRRCHLSRRMRHAPSSTIHL